MTQDPTPHDPQRAYEAALKALAEELLPTPPSPDFMAKLLAIPARHPQTGRPAAWLARQWARVLGPVSGAPGGRHRLMLVGAEGAVMALFFCAGILAGLDGYFSPLPDGEDLSDTWAQSLAIYDMMEDEA